jgi:hypothetical protein
MKTRARGDFFGEPGGALDKAGTAIFEHNHGRHIGSCNWRCRWVAEAVERRADLGNPVDQLKEFPVERPSRSAAPAAVER